MLDFVPQPPDLYATTVSATIHPASHRQEFRLTNTSIQHQDSHIRNNRLANLHHLLKQLALLPMPARRIHNNHIEPFLLELRHTFRGNRYGVGFGVRPEVSDFGFGCGLAGLVECAGAECVGADDGGFEPPALVVDCKLGRGRSRESGNEEGGVWRRVKPLYML